MPAAMPRSVEKRRNPAVAPRVLGDRRLPGCAPSPEACENAALQFHYLGLHVLFVSLMSRAPNLKRSLNLSFSMQSQPGKIRGREIGRHADDQSASDGYYVFVSLICLVAAITTTILVAFGIEMLA